MHVTVPVTECLRYMAHLPSTRLGENHPPIERGPPLFAASARSDPEIRSRAFHCVPEPDLLVSDKSGQAHFPCRAFSLLRTFVVSDALRHAVRFHAFVIDKVR